ncbi:MAG: type II toxin-antitoxin system HigB family toxin [Ewingella americana]|jgi:mRNA interferase HigB|uniref:HigB family toxin n=2 Tax=Ewingella americana TaxID=41202 RepID=A0A085G5E9_EWIA3|nr:type II toxin-antitoxin system HigB family toxin [Ewingella americana]MDN5679017.1 type II toxin-antitoxin system HigB family toxin [Ewingella sp.]NWA37111.1 type II toxin-antitoxin system HigB family toxin [Pseudomonas reactans]KAA8727155.1 cytoplasmic protein [Ewingella americana]KFC78944.1 HigB family toxin [Ewingella americana ATCC 33852]MCI1679812.1 type II toxin-antitoxin system HigB family toxin [Ewingella americana]
MHVVSKGPFDEAAQKFPNDAKALNDVYRAFKRGNFSDPDEMREVFPSLDRMKYRDKWWVVDVGGNNLRLMFFADFEYGRLFIKSISTHAEYDKLVKKYRENPA